MKEKRFINSEIDKKSESLLDFRTVGIAFDAILIGVFFSFVWTERSHLETIAFLLGIISSVIGFFYFICLLSYTYGMIKIRDDGIHYRNVFFAKKAICWENICSIYKAKAYIGGPYSIDVICCAAVNKKSKTIFFIDLAMLREPAYFLIGYSEARMRKIYMLSHGNGLSESNGKD